jgi:hypothetical protein
MSKVKGEFLKELQGIGKKDKEENTEENTEVTVTDINISFVTVFRLVLQFTIASAIVGGVIFVLLLIVQEVFK